MLGLGKVEQKDIVDREKVKVNLTWQDIDGCKVKQKNTTKNNIFDPVKLSCNFSVIAGY